MLFNRNWKHLTRSPIIKAVLNFEDSFKGTHVNHIEEAELPLTVVVIFSIGEEISHVLLHMIKDFHQPLLTTICFRALTTLKKSLSWFLNLSSSMSYQFDFKFLLNRAIISIEALVLKRRTGFRHLGITDFVILDKFRG